MDNSESINEIPQIEIPTALNIEEVLTLAKDLNEICILITSGKLMDVYINQNKTETSV